MIMSRITVMKLISFFILATMFTACSMCPEPQVVEKTKFVYIKQKCKTFKKVVIPKFNHDKISITWGVDNNGFVKSLKHKDMIQLIKLNDDLLKERDAVIRAVDLYNDVGGVYDGNSTKK